jgi:surface antigen/uncharacterized protein YukE
MTKMGMDVEAVESVGRQLKQSAASVESLVGGIDKTVSGLTGLWDGPDAQRFVQQSWPTLRKALVAAQSSVEGLGQSALNNASEQRGASTANGSGSGNATLITPRGTHAEGSPATPAPATHPASQSFGVMGAQRDFDSRHGNASFAPGGSYAGQCTSWVNFRREQLHAEGLVSGPVPTSWKGGHFYPGTVSLEPTPYAVGSFSGGGHTFVVESISEGSPRTISISEMNVGKMVDVDRLETKGLNHVSTATYADLGNGQWQKYVNGKRAGINSLTFGA